MGLNGALAVAARSLEMFSAGIQVAGNNIANANTPGAVRDQLILTSAFPTRQGNLLYGNGVVAQGIRQQIDVYLEKRIHTANAESHGASARRAAYQQLETALQELGAGDLSTAITTLTSRFHDLVNQPENLGAREIAVQQGIDFASQVRALRNRIDDLRTSANSRVNDLVTEANQLIDQVASLNPRITSLEAAGLSQSDAGTLRVQRLNALNRLSEIVPIRTVEHPSGSVDLFVGSDHLIITSSVQHLEVVPGIDRNLPASFVRIENSQQPLTGNQGELNGTLNGRDQILGGFVDRLDLLARNVIQEFNRVHASGQGLKGFTAVKGTDSVASTTVALNAAGLASPPQNGSFQVRVTNLSTGLMTTTDVAIDLDGIGTDTTLDSLAAQLNGIGNLTATISSDRKLTLSSAAGYEFQFAQDTSHTLAALGINTFFTGSDSRTLGVNSVVASDAGYLAARQGGGPGDGSNALALANVFAAPLAALGDKSLEQFYQTSVSLLAQSSASEAAMAGGYEAFTDSLLSQREQFSGVSLDEEIVQILQFQRAFQMSGKLISTIDELFRTLLQI